MQQSIKKFLFIVLLLGLQTIAENDQKFWISERGEVSAQEIDEQYKPFFIELFDYSSEEALLESQKEFLENFPYASTEMFFIEKLGNSERMMHMSRQIRVDDTYNQICIGQCYSYEEMAQILYDWLKPYRPISYDPIADGTEEHFQAMKKFHLEQGSMPNLAMASESFFLDGALRIYKTGEKNWSGNNWNIDRHLENICVDIFDENYITIEGYINNVFPGVNACDPEEVYDAAIRYIASWSMLSKYDSLEDFSQATGFPARYYSYRTLSWVQNFFFEDMPWEGYIVNCFYDGGCGFDGTWEYHIEFFFHYWLQIARVTKGNEFVWFSPHSAEDIIKKTNKFFLFDSIASEADITTRIKTYLPNNQMMVRFMLDASQNEADKREKRISEIYYEILKDPNAIDKLKNPRSYLSETDIASEKYTNLAQSYYMVKNCYDIRKSYASVYVSYEEFQQATSAFNQEAKTINLPNEMKQKLNQQADNTTSKLFLFSDWSEDMNALCAMSQLRFKDASLLFQY
tara:strand:- start:674 stop:2218 length:1545 start_codon:yes stop_codon:yes gene_type:complete